MSVKTTAAEKKLRVYDIYELLMESYTRASILRYGSDKWGASDRTMDNYIRQATDIIDIEAAKEQPKAFNKNLQQRRYLHNKAMEENDLRLAHEIVKDEAKLVGLYPVDKKEIKIDNDGFTDEERVDRIVSLFDKARERRDQQSS